MQSGKVWLVDAREVLNSDEAAYIESYEPELNRLITELDDAIKKYQQLMPPITFVDFNNEPLDDEEKAEFQKIQRDFINELKKIKNEAYKPDVHFVRLGNLIREFDDLTFCFEFEWESLPDKLYLSKNQRDKERHLQEALELSEIKALTEAVTFTHNERARSRALDASNPSKLASKQHRSDKLAVISDYREKNPNESSPTYPKHGFFKVKEQRPARSHLKHQLVSEEMDAYQSLKMRKRKKY